MLESDFDEDDEFIRPNQLQNHYKKKFDMVHTEYILKLLLHTGTNMVLTFPWALAYQAASKRHQLLMKIGNCLGVKGTVEMEDISLERLWWGQWVLPLMMAVLGVMNYGWYRLYVKYGHPWRRLLSSDKERIIEWRSLKLWEMLENQNDNEGEIRTGNDLNRSESVLEISSYNADRDMAVSEDTKLSQEDDSSHDSQVELYREISVENVYIEMNNYVDHIIELVFKVIQDDKETVSVESDHIRELVL